MEQRERRSWFVRRLMTCSLLLACVQPMEAAADLTVVQRWSGIRSSGVNLDVNASMISSADPVATFSEQLAGAGHKGDGIVGPSDRDVLDASLGGLPGPWPGYWRALAHCIAKIS